MQRTERRRDFGRLIAGNIASETLPRPQEIDFKQLKKLPETLCAFFSLSPALSFSRLCDSFPTAGHHLSATKATERRLRGKTTNRNFPAKKEPKRARSGFV